ncbi:MAG: SpoIIE family protein phosphatase [Salibacteraceae bacterium]|nr:SpoIIE family protein phosphatase [Salibacteraceae bacterium]
MIKHILSALIYLAIVSFNLGFSQDRLTDMQMLNQTSAEELGGCIERMNYYKVIGVVDSFEHYLFKAKKIDHENKKPDLVAELLNYYHLKKSNSDSVAYYLEALNSIKKADASLGKEISLIQLKFYRNDLLTDSVDAILNRSFKKAELDKDSLFLLKLWPIKILNVLNARGLIAAKKELTVFVDFLNHQTPSQHTIDAHIVITKLFAYNFRVYSKAVLHAFVAEKQAQGINSTEHLYNVNYIQSNLYDNIGDLEKALYYQRMVLGANQSSSYAHNLANIFNSIGWSHLNMGALDSAEYYLVRSLETYEKYAELDLRSAYPLSNCGILYYKLGNYDLAISFLDSADKKWSAFGIDNRSISGHNEVNTYKGLSLLAQKKYLESKNLLIQTLEDCKKIDDFSNQKEVLKGLIELFVLLEDYKASNEYYKQYIEISDRIEAEENQREINDVELSLLKDEYSETILNLSEAEKLKGNIIEKQNRIIWLIGSVIGVLGMLILALIIFNNKIKLAKEKIELQSETIFSQNIEILDSINCANRIQTSLISMGFSALSTDFDSFLHYKPKDIVGGDFIWSKRFDDASYIVIGDCTGHGVSGAMLGMMAISFLEDLLKNDSLNPAELAKRLKEKVAHLFSQEQERVLSEGMDIAILKFSNSNTCLEYTGANIPLYFIRDNELNIVQPTKASISFSKEDTPFQLVAFQVNEKDKFFLMSDGIRDQFGGPKDKKLGSKRLKSILMDSSNQEIAVQKTIIIDQIESWKGANEQTDDICLVGIEI